MYSYRDLDVYKNAKKLVKEVYALLNTYPKEEQFALCDQLRRAAVSVPSNIAEGMGRMAIKERIHFIEIAYASMIEVLCQLDISKSLGYITQDELTKAEDIAMHLSKVMTGLKKSLENKIQD